MNQLWLLTSTVTGKEAEAESMLKIYKIEVTDAENEDFYFIDIYDSAIVLAESEEEAKHLQLGISIEKDPEWVISPDKVKATLIGIPDTETVKKFKETGERVFCVSYNCG